MSEIHNFEDKQIAFFKTSTFTQPPARFWYDKENDFYGLKVGTETIEIDSSKIAEFISPILLIIVNWLPRVEFDKIINAITEGKWEETQNSFSGTAKVSDNSSDTQTE